LRIDPKVAERVRDLLGEAGDFESLFLRIHPSPWTGAKLADGLAVEQAFDLVNRIKVQTLPAFMASLHALAQHPGLSWPVSLAEARVLIKLLDEVQSSLEVYAVEIYRQDHSMVLRDLAPGKSGGLSGVWAWISNPEYRRARKSVRALRTGGPATVAVLFVELEGIKRQTLQWKSKTTNSSLPCKVDNFVSHKTSIDLFFADAAALDSILCNKPVEQLSVDEFGNLINSLVTDRSTPQQIPKLTQIEKDLERSGVSKFVDEIRAKTPDSSLWMRGFAYSWLASALDAASQSDNEIRGFKGVTHNRYVDEFAHLDEERIAVAAERVRRAHGLRAIEALNAHPDQQHLIKAEAAKAKRHLPLRKVFAQAAEVLTAVCPCWMASPLSVSQLLDGGKQYFDFVIFDEASQVLPEDAIPSVLRGKQLVVAGDNNQLPPTTFFAASDDDDVAAEEEESAAEGFESLLDMMIPFVRSCHLNWHYRSRDEALINFSNHYIYKDRLVTFPGPGGPAVINHELVQQEIGIDGQEDSSGAEVNKVVELVLGHAREHPRETLGVITMGIKHMNRVQAALDRELERHSELEEFFDPNVHERFFVKNLERVQGDERDAIIISIGYGKDRAGNLPMRFGPLLSTGGRRRLNVAITRARQKLTVVSAFSHLDIDLTRVRAGSGVELLRDYLQYAVSKGKRLGDGQLTTIPLNEFEADVFDVLTTQGVKLIPQLGASQFRIDMVAEHPKNPGRFVLAIECDGATYHSSCTARDRDRLRQQQLESLGWRFHRIWSTDWFMRKEEEVKRSLNAFQAAVRYADNLDAGVGQSESLSGNGKPRIGESDNASLTTRGPKPRIPIRTSIMQYSQYEIGQFIQWVSSDGRLRTDDEIITEMITVLGFSRRGARIDAAIKSALQVYRTSD
jgi:very-short-patch-repair endonuclease